MSVVAVSCQYVSGPLFWPDTHAGCRPQSIFGLEWIVRTGATGTDKDAGFALGDLLAERAATYPECDEGDLRATLQAVALRSRCCDCVRACLCKCAACSFLIASKVESLQGTWRLGRPPGDFAFPKSARKTCASSPDSLSPFRSRAKPPADATLKYMRRLKWNKLFSSLMGRRKITTLATKTRLCGLSSSSKASR